MIDTLKVYSHDFAIKDGANLIIQPNTIDYSTGDIQEVELFKDGFNRPVYGSKAYVNSDRYNLTIKGMPKGGVCLFLQMSMPKAYKGENYYPLSDGETQDTLIKVQDDLQDKGIGINLGKSKVSRLDVFKNISASELFSSYVPVFQLLKAKRQLRRDYGTTFLWENTRREICVYDKLIEMENRGIETHRYPANSIRFEYRLKNSGVCAQELKMETFSEVVNNLQDVRGIYQGAMEKHLFGFDAEGINILTGSEFEKTLIQYEAKGGHSMQMYLRDFGAYHLYKLVGEDTAKAVISRVYGSNRMKAWRLVKLMDESKRNYELLTETAEHKTLADLYMELKGAVLNE